MLKQHFEAIVGALRLVKPRRETTPDYGATKLSPEYVQWQKTVITLAVTLDELFTDFNVRTFYLACGLPIHQWPELVEVVPQHLLRVECDRCDGCGWYEGGQSLQTKCGKCNGLGSVPA